MIILLRCIVESTDKAIAQSCKTSLRRFWTKLQNAAENDGWDLADICIAQCADSVSKILSGNVDMRSNHKDQQIELQPLDQAEGSSGMTPGAGGTISDLMPDILPFSNPDISFDNQWDVGSWYGLGWMGSGMDAGSYEGFNQGIFHV